MRFDHILIDKYRSIGSHLGFVFIIIGGLLLTPLLAIPFFPQEIKYINAFIIPGIPLIILGGLFYFRFAKIRSYPLLTHEAGVIVLSAWLIAFLSSAIPFSIILKIGFPQALFESVSGWTTTGLSVINVSESPYIILLWRSIMQLAGGAGFAIMMVAALTGISGSGLSKAEGRSDQLVPQVRRSAQIVMLIYIIYLLFGVIAYVLAGMSFFDAINHTFCAISTGGFSTQPDSIGRWNSAGVEAVTIILMIFGNLNFIVAYLLLQLRFRAFLKNGEIRLFVFLLIIGTAILFFHTTSVFYGNMSKSIRVAIFEVVSALTTTGFSTVSYNTWNDGGLTLLIILMLIGGGACSTAGGIKQYRIFILLKALVWEIRKWLYPPNAIIQPYIWEADRKNFISERQIKTISLFLFLYLLTYFLGTFAIVLQGIPLKDALFEFASALGTVGLSVGVTSLHMSPTILWTELVGMFLGRLEFFIIIVSSITLIKDIWRMATMKRR